MDMLIWLVKALARLADRWTGVPAICCSVHNELTPSCFLKGDTWRCLSCGATWKDGAALLALLVVEDLRSE